MSGGSLTLADRLVVARRRAGLSREQLAVDAGLSWSAIAQIEAGRRVNPRADTVAALAAALDVTVEYLLGSSDETPTLLDHHALIYSDVADLVATAGPLLEGSAARGEAILVVTGRANLKALRDHLGEDADQVTFADSKAWYGSPQDALAAYRRFAGEALDAGAPWVSIIGEPTWPGPIDKAVEMWTRYEAVLELALVGLPATITCVYNANSLDRRIMAVAPATHRRSLERGKSITNAGFRDPTDFVL